MLVLLIVTATSLRGYLPGIQRSAQPESPHTGHSLVYVGALLGASLTIVALALLARLRDPRQKARAAAALTERFGGGAGAPAWRVLLIGAGVLLIWLVLLWVFSHFLGTHQLDQPSSAPPASTPAPAGAPPQPGPAPDRGPDRTVLRYLTVSTVALIAMIIVGAVVDQRRRVALEAVASSQPFADGAPAVTAAAESLARAAESGLAEVEDPNQEPRQAIISCYAAMERELRRFPGAAPQDFDTPTEVLARAVEHRALRAQSAEELVNLFEEARFSPHVMTETHRGRAVDVLQLVLDDMRGAA